MRLQPRQRVRELAGSWLGDRPVPVGGVARDRRLLRRALDERNLGRVLVVGPGIAVRQAFPDAPVDVAGTSPHMDEVTVCSTAGDAGSLPAGRWDTVIVSEPGPDLAARLRAVVPACRARGRLVLLDRVGWPPAGPEAQALERVADLTRVVGRPRHRLWLADRRP